MQMFKCFLRKRFYENISYLLLFTDIFQDDVLFSYFLIEEMILDWYVFGS